MSEAAASVTAPSAQTTTEANGDSKQSSNNGSVVKGSGGAGEGTGATPAERIADAMESGQPKEAKETDPYEDINKVLKEKKIQYKRGKKEVTLDSLEKLIRRDQQFEGLEQALNEYKGKLAEYQALASKREALKNSNSKEEKIKLFQELYGDDPSDLAEEIVYRKLSKEKELQSLTPTERKYREEIEKRDAELSSYKQKELAEKQRYEQQYQEQVTHQIRETLSRAAMVALQKVGASQETAPAILAEIAPYMQEAMELGIEIDPETVAEKVIDNRMQWQKDFSAKMDGEALVKWLGEDTVNKIRKYDLARYKARQAQPQQPTVKAEEKKEEPNVNGDRWAWLKSQGLV